MEKLAEYLPLLIIMLTILFTFIGKKKKSDNVTQETSQQRQTPGKFIDEIELPPMITSSYQTLKEEKPKRKTLQRPEKIEKKRIVPVFSPESPIIEEEKENSPFSIDADNIIQAIVLSEIINRKEY